MKIGIVTTWFERGASYVSRQYRKILERDHDVYIYARGGEFYAKGDPVWDDDKIYWGKRSVIPMRTAVNIRDFRKWLLQNKIETVFFNEQMWWEPVILCSRLGLKTGAYIDYYTEETIPLFKCYDFVICNTRRHHSAFSEHQQSFHVPWGTELDLFQSKTFEHVEPGAVTFFHSSGISPERKGTRFVVEAFSQIDGPARLFIHSQVDLRERVPALIPLVDDLLMKKALVLEEKTVPAPGLYSSGDIYVYPSLLDGIGLTIAEALSSGLPVIVSDNPPMNEFVEESNGRLVSVERLFSRSDGYYWPQCKVSMESLIQAMQYYVDQMENIPRYKRAARSYAEKHLDWNKNASELNGIFERTKIISRPAKAAAEKEAAAFDKKIFSLSSTLLQLSRHLTPIFRMGRFLKSKFENEIGE